MRSRWKINNRHFQWMLRISMALTSFSDTRWGYLVTFRITSMTLGWVSSRQNGRHFADDIFKCIFLNENVWIPIKISLKFVPNGPINDIPALVQIMAWRRSGDKPLSEPMVVSLPTHICVTQPQWVKFNGLSGDIRHRGPYSPYKPCNNSLYIGIIIFPSHR